VVPRRQQAVQDGPAQYCQEVELHVQAAFDGRYYQQVRLLSLFFVIDRKFQLTLDTPKLS